MKEVLLTRGMVALVDDADFDFLSKHSWCYRIGRNRRTGYAESNISINGEWTRVLMHRYIMDADRKVEIDHRDGNGLNNQRANLRIATHSQNLHNSHPHRRPKTSKYKGVCWHKAMKKWHAQIRINGRAISIGFFDSQEDAARAYDATSRLHCGEFSKQNLAIGTGNDSQDSLQSECRGYYSTSNRESNKMGNDLLTFYQEKPGASRQVSVRVTAEQYEFLGELAERAGVSKADLFRLALEEWLKTGPHAKVASEIVKKRTKT